MFMPEYYEELDKEKAWKLYCDETKGGMDVKDFWEELSPKVQKIYLDKVQ